MFYFLGKHKPGRPGSAAQQATKTHIYKNPKYIALPESLVGDGGFGTLEIINTNNFHFLQ